MFLLLAYVYCKAYRAKRPSLDIMNKSAQPVKGKLFLGGNSHDGIFFYFLF